MNRITFTTRLVAATAATFVTFVLLQWVAVLGDDSRAGQLASAELAKAAATAPKERL